jgi:formate-dependent nitrite reductase membrane component NrfD
MNDKLHILMNELLRSGWQSNPAMKALVSDYARYHAIFVIAANVALLALLTMSAFFWARSRKISRTGASGEVFERRVFRSFALLCGLVSLTFMLLIAANAPHAFSPTNVLQGFSLLAAPPEDSAVGRSLLAWIESNSVQPPPLITQRVHDRLSWQAPKAIICGMLFIAIVALSVRIWSSLIKRKKQKRATTTRLIAGTIAVALSLLLLIMVIANTQGALAPLSISVLLPG